MFVIEVSIYLTLQMNGHTQFPKEREEGRLDEEELDEDEAVLEDVEVDEDEVKEMVLTQTADSRLKEHEKVSGE